MSSSKILTKRKNAATKPDPNPLFKQWIREWRDEAASKGWKTHYTYSKALKSLEQFPLVLKSGKEAIILEAFGEKICQMLDDKLTDFRAAGGITPTYGPTLTIDSDSDEPVSSSTSTSLLIKQAKTVRSPKCKTDSKAKDGKQYIPAPHSGPYAILIALHTAEVDLNKNTLCKTELMKQAQPLCDTSFTIPNPGSRYTAWSSIGTLIKKQLIIKEGNPARYSLTDCGRELSGKLSENLFTSSQLSHEPSSQVSSLQSSQESSSSSQQYIQQLLISTSKPASPSKRSPKKLLQVEAVESYTLMPGTFDILLCVDSCETSGGGSGAAIRKQSLVPELQKNGVAFEVRKLHVGDFLWVAREKVQPEPGQLRIREPRELVLDFVVERKRMDDLASSIKDGRFHEQKFRLRNSGIRRPVYLVEDYGSETNCFGISEKALIQSVSNTQIVDDFFVKKTKDLKESVAYLTLMTRALSRTYSCRNLKSCTSVELKDGNCSSNTFITFQEFNTMSIKNKVMTAKDMFMKQLLQLSGLSVDKAIAITNVYDTPAKLIAAYESCETIKEKEKLLSCLKYGIHKRNLGPSISKILYSFYMTDFTKT